MLFLIEKGISFLQIGTLYAIREISIILLEVPTGIAADILGRKNTMAVSFMAYIISFITFYFSYNFYWLIIAMLFFSIGDAMRTGTHKAMIFDYLKINSWQKFNVDYYGHTRSWSQFGSAISSIIAAFIVILTGNYQQIFLISTIPYFLDMILILSYPKSLDGPLKTDYLGLKHRLIEYRLQLITSLKQKENWKIYLNISSYHGLFKASKDYLQPLIIIGVIGFLNLDQSTNKSKIAIGFVYFFIYMASSIIARHSNSILKPFGSIQKALNITLFIGIIIFLLTGVFSSINLSKLSALVFIIIFIIQNFRKPIGAAIIAEKTNTNILATGLSIQSLFDALFASIIAITLGFLSDTFSIEYAILIIGALFLFIFPVLRLKH